MVVNEPAIRPEGPGYQYPQGMFSWPSMAPGMPVQHIGHRNHLCDLAEQGNITLEQMKELVRNPKFICRKCGRVAAKEENLCEPVSL